MSKVVTTVKGIVESPLIGTVELFVSLFLTGLLAYLWHRFRKLENKLENSMSKTDVKEMIKDKIRPIEVAVKLYSEDIKDIGKKLDRLIEHQLDKRNREE